VIISILNKKTVCFWCLLLVFAAHRLAATVPPQTDPDVQTKTLLSDEQLWTELTKDLEYPIPETKPPLEAPAIQPDNEATHSSTFFIILISIAIITLLIFLLLKNQTPPNPALAPEAKVDIAHIEENWQESDLHDFIRQAVEQGDYAVATRLYYLAAIKQLIFTKKIKWQKDKTNGQYLSELRDTPLFEPFRELTHAFEAVWYGQKTISETGFAQLASRFESFLKLARHA